MKIDQETGNHNTVKRVLVTGGAGFLGSHLCERLLEQGSNVLCVDNLFTGSVANISHLIENPNFKFINHDITIPLEAEVDEIYNLACPASPIHYQQDPVKTIQTNVIGAINMLNLATSCGAKILQSSTSEIYGDPEVHPQTENYWGRVNPIGIRSCYDEGKRCAETLFFDYHRQFSTRIKVARIFNTYGPRMHPEDGRVVSNFIIQALGNNEMTIYGSGAQTRSFCYVDDLINGLVLLMDSNDEMTGPVNFGNPHEISMLQLADNIASLLGTNSKLEFLPLPTDDPQQRRPDITLAKKHFNWEPKIELEVGLQRTISYFKSL